MPFGPPDSKAIPGVRWIDKILLMPRHRMERSNGAAICSGDALTQREEGNCQLINSLIVRLANLHLISSQEKHPETQCHRKMSWASLVRKRYSHLCTLSNHLNVCQSEVCESLALPEKGISSSHPETDPSQENEQGANLERLPILFCGWNRDATRDDGVFSVVVLNCQVLVVWCDGCHSRIMCPTTQENCRLWPSFNCVHGCCDGGKRLLNRPVTTGFSHWCNVDAVGGGGVLGRHPSVGDRWRCDVAGVKL